MQQDFYTFFDFFLRDFNGYIDFGADFSGAFDPFTGWKLWNDHGTGKAIHRNVILGHAFSGVVTDYDYLSEK